MLVLVPKSSNWLLTFLRLCTRLSSTAALRTLLCPVNGNQPQYHLSSRTTAQTLNWLTIGVFLFCHRCQKYLKKYSMSSIVTYLDKQSILFAGQHGFRKGHSCETALHELISDLNVARDSWLISMLLFIDYRKAFDSVDSNLLLLKLFLYDFTNSALALVGDYFKGRSQCTKVQGKVSEPADILLGVTQGSVLGPLFFLLFINDLAYLLQGLSSKLFADDTTIYSSGPDLDSVVKDFQARIKPLSTWCSLNRLDINWSKTFVMFVTKERVSLPSSVDLNGVSVSVVTEFKLLGVTLDNKLNFDKHISIVCRQINSKLFSGVFSIWTHLSSFNSLKHLFFLILTIVCPFLYTLLNLWLKSSLNAFIYFYINFLILILTQCQPTPYTLSCPNMVCLPLRTDCFSDSWPSPIG